MREGFGVVWLGRSANQLVWESTHGLMMCLMFHVVMCPLVLNKS